MKRLLTVAMVLASLFLGACANNNIWSSTDGVVADNGVKIQKNRRSLRAKLGNSTSPGVGESNDIWKRVRLGFDIPDPDVAITIKHTNQLAANPEALNRLMQRSSNYLFYIIEEVEARNMPSELALLPFVESAFNPKAVSPAKASGMWQFMPATGKDFNLTQNLFRDERRDIIHSTRAALDYLQRLYGLFGDWQLALAAYNWGEGAVAKAIKRNQAAGLPTDYFSLQMPNETKNYVPKLLAYKRIVNTPESYGLVLPKVEDHPYFVAVTPPRDIDLDLAISFAEISSEEFISLNPSFTKPVILKASNPKILLPFGKAEIFQYNLAKYQGSLSTWTAVLVDRTDSLDKVAASLNVDPNQLRELNGIPRGMRIRAGSTVLIPKTNNHTADVPLYLADNAELNLEKEYMPALLKCKSKNCMQFPAGAIVQKNLSLNQRKLNATSSASIVNNSKKSVIKVRPEMKNEAKSAGKNSSSHVKKTVVK